MKASTEINSWLIVLVVLATAGITSWVMLTGKASQDENPAYYYVPQQVAQNLSPVATAIDKGWFLTAGATTIPVLRAGAVPVHPDRGICTNCHTVVSSRGKAIPNISATSAMTHEYRGVCFNCHHLVIKNNPSANTGNVQAAIRVAATGRAIAPRTAAPAKAVLEGEWLGMEVAPITSVTALQYGIPYGTQGLVIAEAEAQALTVGLKAGDVVFWVNGVPICNMTNFLRVTRNGTLTQGTVKVLRKGQKLTVNIASTVIANAPVNAPWANGQGVNNTPGWQPGGVSPKQF